MKRQISAILSLVFLLTGTGLGEEDKRISQLKFALDVDASAIRLEGGKLVFEDFFK